MLVDTSVWVDHLRYGNRHLARFLEDAEVETHPFVIGELACGNLKRRGEILSLLSVLPRVVEADHDEVSTLVESRRLYGKGLGWVDMHLLASSVLSKTPLWTRDRRLAEHAGRLKVLFRPST